MGRISGCMRFCGTTAAAVVIALLAVTWPATAAADLGRMVQFNIAPQALGDALVQYSQQSGVQVTSPAEIIGNKASRGVMGSLKAGTALDLLLKDTHLGYSVIGRNTVALHSLDGAEAEAKTNAAEDATEAAVENAADSQERIEPAGGQSRGALLHMAQTESQSTGSGDDTPQTSAGSPQDNKLEQVVVTGTFMPVSKQKATTAISILGEADIAPLVPVNALDLLSNIPGVFVDTSQGSLNFGSYIPGTATVTSRGLSFVSIEEDGLPVEGGGAPITDLGVYGNNGALLRADASLERIEAVRGGSASVTGANAPGGIFNYISKTGGDVLSGMASASYGLQGDGKLPYRRGDFDVGGPLAAGGWYFNIGGYYQSDYGIRDTGYLSDYGGQLKGNIVKKFDHGMVEFYAKFLDDHNFLNSTVLPATNWASPTLVPGWSNTSSPVMPASSFQYRTGQDSYAHFDAGNLAQTKSVSLGLKFNLEFGTGWTVDNNLRFANNKTIWNVDDFGEPSPLTDIYPPYFFGTYGMPGTYTYRDPVNGSFAQVTSPDGYNYTVLNNTLPGTAALPNTLLLHGPAAWRTTEKEWQDQVSLTKKFAAMAFTVGAYFDHATQSSYAPLAATGVSTYTPQPQMLDVTFQTPNGQVLQLTDPQGFAQSQAAASNFPHSTWNQLALFFGHSWQFAHKWNFDWGLRYEMVDVNAYNDSGNDFAASSPVSDQFYANQYYVIAPLYHVTRSVDTLAYSAAINRELTDNSSVYFRYSLGKKSPELGFYQGLNSPSVANATPTIPQTVTQWEFGYKFIKPHYSLEVTPYYSVLSDIANDILTTVQANGTPGLYGATTPANKTSDYGVEVDARARLDYGFAIRAALTWQRSKEINSYGWTQPNGPGPASDPLSNAVLVDNNAGLRAANIPDIMATIAPSYTRGPFFVQVQWQYMGSREANNYDAFVLPAYDQTNITLQWQFSKSLTLSFTENNVFDTKGIVEWAVPGDFATIGTSGNYTRADVLANPNAVFNILQVPARSYFLKLTYSP